MLSAYLLIDSELRHLAITASDITEGGALYCGKGNVKIEYRIAMLRVLANEFFAFGRRDGTFPTAAVKGGGT